MLLTLMLNQIHLSTTRADPLGVGGGGGGGRFTLSFAVDLQVMEGISTWVVTN